MKDLIVSFFINETEFRKLALPASEVEAFLPRNHTDYYRSLIPMVLQLNKHDMPCVDMPGVLMQSLRLLSVAVGMGRDDNNFMPAMLDLLLCLHLSLHPYDGGGEITIEIIQLIDILLGDSGSVSDWSEPK